MIATPVDAPTQESVGGKHHATNVSVHQTRTVTPMDPSLVAPTYASFINDLDTKADADVAADLNNICSNQAEIESFFPGLSTDQVNTLESELSNGRWDSILNTMTAANKALWVDYYVDLVQKGIVTTPIAPAS